MVICVDFDGTCVMQEYPLTGRDIGAVPVLKALVENQHKLVLFTLRSGRSLERAVSWFQKNDIELYGVNRNPKQYRWTSSPKAHCQLYIDDRALGAPLLRKWGRSYIDWQQVRSLLVEQAILPK